MAAPAENESSQTGLALQAMLAEYQTLRQESLQAITNRINVVNFTFGAMSVILAGLLTRQVSDLLGGLVAVLVAPQVAKAGLLIWLGEYNRSQRAGRWLAQLESRINSLVANRAMDWEQWLASGDTHMSYPYKANVFITAGLGYASEVLGVYLLALQMRSLSNGSLFLVVALLTSAIVALEGGFLRYFAVQWRTAVSGKAEGPQRPEDDPDTV
ncbi:MAG: hypothetical protein LC808_32225 [Actinobacteria bacterium]|nr:hypothetical protein [Actinomycetota bacterium]